MRQAGNHRCGPQLKASTLGLFQTLRMILDFFNAGLGIVNGLPHGVNLSQINLSLFNIPRVTRRQGPRHEAHACGQMRLVGTVQYITHISVFFCKGDHGRLRHRRLLVCQSNLSSAAPLSLGSVDFLQTCGLGKDPSLQPCRRIQCHAIILGNFRLFLPHQLG